ncbi:hypothetical protein LIER_17340 [Lithospermum erythrorhizon]|uniref:NAB domain-containing protein n=1 Tax=Lithospermum erythrorhizon TaxID=34254 RepID=A0AAV3QD90_LITER
MFTKKISTAMLIAEMDQNIKRMSKLVEEDADSFAKKAEMYYQKRPELISIVEEFHRMYRSLSERYDATRELRRNIPSDIQSQASCISEAGSQLPSACPSPDLWPNRPRSGARADGFDLFLATNRNCMDLGYREGDESSPLGSESESDAYSVVNDDEPVLRRKIYELEVERRSAKEKQRIHQEDNSECSSTGSRNRNVEADRPHTTAYEEELRDIKEKLRLSEEEVSRLQDHISRYKSSLSDREQEIRRLIETITNADRKLSEENSQLKVEITKLQKERTYLENNLKEQDVRCQSLRRALAGKAEMKTSPGVEAELLKQMVTEKTNEVEELTRSLAAITRNYNMIVAEKAKLGAKVEELTIDMSLKDDRIDAMCQHLHQLQMEHVKLMDITEEEHKKGEELRSRAEELETTIKQQEEIIQEGAEEKREAIRQLSVSLEHYRSGYLRLRDVVVNHMSSPVMAA